jgi:hypothetical protein
MVSLAKCEESKSFNVTTYGLFSLSVLDPFMPGGTGEHAFKELINENPEVCLSLFRAIWSKR